MPDTAKHYDYLVIGSGSATTAADLALSQGLKVALVDKEPTGGTCLTVGCIPSKLLVYPADRVVEIEEAAKLGIYAEIMRVDFGAIMGRMRATVAAGMRHIRQGLESTENLDFYDGEGRFLSDYTLEVKGHTISADRIIIGAGARPHVPPVEGLDQVEYLTNESLLQLEERPDSLIIIGGGYIAAEYGHFFAAMGTKVTIIQNEDRLVSSEEPEISDLLARKLSERMEIHLNTEAVSVRRAPEGVEVKARTLPNQESVNFRAQRLLVATGRTSNADRLHVEATGVETDARGYIRVNPRMETSKENIWALGDVLGKYMFKHVANEEAYVAAHNSLHDEKLEMDYHAVPRAVFSHPQIASVGLTERAAREEHDILIGHSHYSDVAKGDAMMERDGFAKAIVERESREILGFHLIGPYAPILIQEVVDIMALHGTTGHLFSAMHIHPALPELVQRTLAHLHEPAPVH